MKNAIRVALILVVAGIALNGCKPKEDPTYRMSDLLGLWLEDKANVEHYVRFTDEQSDETAYWYGREWNEDEDIYEEDLFKLWNVDSVYVVDTLTMDSTLVLDSTLVHGNGWFKYKLEIKGDLEEIHLMDNGGADIPKEYIVSILTDVRLEYYEKDNQNRRFCFDKVVKQ